MKTRPLTIVASSLVNACGEGIDAVRATLRSERTSLRPFDLDWCPEFPTWIGRVASLEATRMPKGFAHLDSRSNRLAHVCLEQDGFRSAVEAVRARYGRDRIGLFLGTTTSGILETELAYRAWRTDASDMPLSSAPRLSRAVHNMHATTAYVEDQLGLAGLTQTISTACSSSAKAFAAASRCIVAGLCDAAVVGGVDSLALSTLLGFKSLELVSTGPCRPFAADRDGISIGEGAGFALLVPDGDGAVQLSGFGESSDAWHMSAPHPEGVGAAAAIRNALAAAGLEASAIDYVNLHGTASRANDAAEDRAIVSVFGERTPVSSTKGYTGHTLGAAGITEALLTAMALEDQWIPGTTNCDIVDPTFRAALLLRGQPKQLKSAVSNSFGFGGSNCALLFEVVQ